MSVCKRCLQLVALDNEVVNEGVQKTHSRVFNIEQCKYLVDKLGEVVECSSFFLKTTRSTIDGLCSSKGMGNHLVNLKLLMVLAMETQGFVQGCGKDAWLPSAMTLSNISDYVSYIGFHLELCRAAFCQDCKARGGLNLDEVVDISKDVSGAVKAKAVVDERALVERVLLALPGLQGEEKELASYLLQRLIGVAPTASAVSPKSTRSFFQYWTLVGRGFANVKKKKSIGKRSFGTVYKATWLGMQVAEKVFYGQNNCNFKEEVEILAGLCHSNITLFCCTQGKQKSSIVMELMDGDLFELMEQRLEKSGACPPFSMWEAIDIMHQIAKGGKYLHEQKIMHKDLKSKNILVKGMKTSEGEMEYTHVKLTDFNVSRIKRSNITYSKQTMNVGSKRWMAPELMELHSSSNEVNVGESAPSLKYPCKCDIYSFAMVCLEILTGDLPFVDFNAWESTKMKETILGGFRPKLPNECPMELKALIEECWSAKPRSRPSFDKICKRSKYMKYKLIAGSFSLSKIQDPCEEGPKEKILAQELNTLILKNCVTPYKPIGKIDNALENLDKAVELEPHDAFILTRRGEIKRMTGKYADALENLNKANELEPFSALTLTNCGESKRVLGKYVDALEDLNKASDFAPFDVENLKRSGEANRMMGKYADALEDLNKANDLAPFDALILKRRGEVKRLMGKYVDALEDLNKANDIAPFNAFTIKKRGEVKKMMGKYANVLEDLNKANELELHDVFTLTSRGDVKAMMGRYVDALEDLNKANHIAPFDVEFLKRRGEVNRMMGKYVDALEDLNKANELELHDAFKLTNRGDVKAMMGRYTNALEDLNKANELVPFDVETLKRRGEVNKMMGKYADALEDLNKAHELEPHDAFTLTSCGGVKARMDRYANALNDFNKAYDLVPFDVETLKRRSEVKRMMGKYADALEDLNKAYDLEPFDALTLAGRGEVKKMLGKDADALEDLLNLNHVMFLF